jgi:hypothetical protein
MLTPKTGRKKGNGVSSSTPTAVVFVPIRKDVFILSTCRPYSLTPLERAPQSSKPWVGVMRRHREPSPLAYLLRREGLRASCSGSSL